MKSAAPAPLVISQLRALDAVCDRFEESWRSGQRPSIEAYLVQVEEAVQPELLAELVRLELEWRYRLGEEPSVEEYIQRHAACKDKVETWIREARAATLPSGSTFPTLGTNLHCPRFSNPVLGEYELLEPLGHGGMGEVWKARHRRLDKLVALKRIAADGHKDPQARGRFLKEMKAVGSLEHPNLIEAHDAGEHEGVVFLVMKLLEGKDLGQLVREGGPLPVRQACRLMHQAALGLQYLHEHGLVHRDIKPSNLMRLPNGTLKILDFGLARCSKGTATEKSLGSGQVVGTPDYVAPEQIDGARSLDSRADLYSLGATLFHLLTGRPPFAHHKELWPKLDAHRREPPPAVRALRPDVPPALAELVAQMLAKRPEDRPQTPAAAAAALASFGEEGSTADQSPGRRPVRGRRPWLAWAGGIAALVLVGVVGLDRFGGLWSRPAGGSNGGDPTRSVPPALPLEVLRWEASYVENDNGVGKPGGLLGESAFRPRLGDSLDRIEAELSEPAYAYLIAYRPDGEEEPCWPPLPREGEPPPAVRQPRYPPLGIDDVYDLNEGAGLQVFVLAASRRPLPAYRAWKASHGKAPWKKEQLPEPLAGVVWRDRGLGLEGWDREHPFRSGGTSADRAQGASKLGLGAVVQLKRWWKEQPEIEVVAVLAMTVVPR
jgi:serine/threonine protein kinase